MKQEIIGLFKKVYKKLLRKMPHGVIQGESWILGDCSLFQHNTFTKE